MTRTLQQRLTLTLFATLLTVAVGSVGGYFFGCALALYRTHDDLTLYADRVQLRATSFLDEAAGLLETLNSQPAADPCSELALSNLRAMVFRSQFVYDIGHLRGGRIDCAATQGRWRRPAKAPQTTHVERYNGRIYYHARNYPSLDMGAENVGFQLGDYYAVFSQFRFAGLNESEIRFFRLVGDGVPGFVRRQMAGVVEVDPAAFGHVGVQWKNGYLFVTRCNALPQRPGCTTAYLSTPQALWMNRAQTVLCTFAGGLIGLLLGFYWSIVFRRSLSIDKQLRRAIRRGEIRVLYQPIVDMASGKIVEAEALARWTDEDGFLVSPATFVPLAEQGGFIGELTEVVLRQALRDLSEMLRIDPAFRLNVNISALDLAGEGLETMLEQGLAVNGLSARHLVLEVTESSTAQSPEARQRIRLLRARGHGIHIDDFGTGYSSLAYLQDLEVDAIKIDRAFIQTIGTGAVTACILPQILSMADTLALQVVAEGIETAEQAAYFNASGRKVLGQGWLFGRPMPSAALRSILVEARAQEPSPSAVD